ncbi:hypothetical protein T06_2347 [Trichinella sp. T6]|nr:hypothetical protein T06_2347 [Trichinella sp. T6]
MPRRIRLRRHNAEEEHRVVMAIMVQMDPAVRCVVKPIRTAATLLRTVLKPNSAEVPTIRILVNTLLKPPQHHHTPTSR